MKLASFIVVAILHSQNLPTVCAADGGLRENQAVKNDILDGEKDRMLQSYCGGGSRGNGICADGTCCSQWGYCGTGSDYCSGSTSSGGTCGGGTRGNGICADGTCCSQWGYCGTGSAYCSGGTGPSPTPAPGSTSSGGTCGGGYRGNGICADGTCCSQWGWCGTDSSYCSGGTGPSPTPPTTSGSGQSAYVTYHNYYAGESLTDVACSDGSNGLMTRWGYTTLDPMLPYVGAVSNIAWNSPNCGGCYALSANGKTVYITAIDGCGSVGGYALHFDLHPTAFTELLGQTGVNAGHGTATATKVSSSYCRGNKG